MSLFVIARPRQSGKTTDVIEWLRGGERTGGYPGWTRVMLVPTRQMVDLLRHQIWNTLEDFDHRVYSFEEWSHAHNVHADTEVMVDNIEWVIPRIPGRLIGFTVTGHTEDGAGQ